MRLEGLSSRGRWIHTGTLKMQIGLYEVIELLGDGGMGSVYRARDPRFDREVALKVLHPHFQRNPDVVQRFKTEAVVQAKLSHPHIVSVYDFLADDAGLAIVMELVDGDSAERFVETTGPLSIDRGLKLFEQVLEAIGYAHEQGLIHRDVKPSNILIQEVTGSEVAKVVDFGIAKIVGSDRQRTATAAKLGTLAYMSPEQVKSPKDADERSDIYSLGATLQQLLTGTLPFEGESDYDVMSAILTAEPAPPLRNGQPLPERIDRAIRKALLRDPDQRFQKCGEFLDALRGGGIELPPPHEGSPTSPSSPLVEAKPSTASVPQGHRPLRRLFSGLTTALLALLLLGGGTTAWLSYRAYRENAAETAQQIALAEAKARRAEEAAAEETRRLQAEAEVQKKREQERQRQDRLDRQRLEQERERAEEQRRQKREREKRRLVAARTDLEAAIRLASKTAQQGDLEGARERLQAARAAVPRDLSAELDSQLSTVQERLLEIDRKILARDNDLQMAQAREAARRQVFEDQLALARSHLAKGHFPEAKNVTEQVLEQTDLPADLRSQGEALVEAAKDGLANAWRDAQIGQTTQRKKKPPDS